MTDPALVRCHTCRAIVPTCQSVGQCCPACDHPCPDCGKVEGSFACKIRHIHLQSGWARADHE